MSSEKSTRLPKSALKRYAEIILRQVYQAGGRERYVPVAELEDELGIEQWRILELCRDRLIGELHVSWRLPTEVEQSGECWGPAERLLWRSCFAQPHVRVRPDHVRLTEGELLRDGSKRKKKKKRKKKRC